ncbi:MLO-like protein 3 [Vitis vinifera]|uniref:MLO-like protein n=1 Tax=Vitis vinifera TaxID=29760 RepID=A0A438DWB6_VITVI|nr:MLO-like protein 3 [Vitis vinifera]
MATGNNSVRSLEHTPTWALAVVCFFFIAISIVLEHCIHLLTNWLKRHRKTALCDAVDRLKSELMLLGFMSLLLAVTQEPISKICIPPKYADKMLPCRRLVEDQSANTTDPCTSKGMVSIVTQKGIQQLQIFIFVLAVMQIVYSVLTMALGRLKMRRWSAWEKETQTTEYLVANDPNRFRFTRQTTFGRRHMSSCTETSLQLWTKCFFRQFFRSVVKVDYITLRHGFISAHLAPNSNFNFQKYIRRSLDEDFKVVVSISPLMRFIVVIFLLLDVHGWHVYLWVSCVPLLIVLILGTKLEVIVERMALQLKHQNYVIKGTPLVKPNDNLFWFEDPRFVLTLIHYTLFTIEFGWDSCYHEHTVITAIRVALASSPLQLYYTSPVCTSDTGEAFLKSVALSPPPVHGITIQGKALEEQTAKIIKQWHAELGGSPTSKGEIVEVEEEESVRNEAAWSRFRSMAPMLELPAVKRDGRWKERE